MNWFNKDVDEISKELKTDVRKGLSDEEVKKRQQEKGFNELEEKKKKMTE